MNATNLIGIDRFRPCDVQIEMRVLLLFRDGTVIDRAFRSGEWTYTLASGDTYSVADTFGAYVTCHVNY